MAALGSFNIPWTPSRMTLHVAGIDFLRLGPNYMVAELFGEDTYVIEDNAENLKLSSQKDIPGKKRALHYVGYLHFEVYL